MMRYHELFQIPLERTQLHHFEFFFYGDLFIEVSKVLNLNAYGTCCDVVWIVQCVTPFKSSANGWLFCLPTYGIKRITYTKFWC